MAHADRQHVALGAGRVGEQDPALGKFPGESHKRNGFAKPLLNNNSRRPPLLDDRADLVERREDVLG